jgi:hypothetical protein
MHKNKMKRQKMKKRVNPTTTIIMKRVMRKKIMGRRIQ